MKAAIREETFRPSASTSTRPISQIIEDMLSHLAEIVRAELRLVQTEIRRDLRDAGKAGIYLAVAGLFGLLALGFLLLGAVYGLATVLPMWLAAVTVGLVVGAVGVVLLAVGLHMMKSVSLTPHQTIETLEDNFAWIKKHAG